MHVTEVASDLAAEQQALDDLLTEVDDEAWVTPTSSPRWSCLLYTSPSPRDS